MFTVVGVALLASAQCAGLQSTGTSAMPDPGHMVDLETAFGEQLFGLPV
jgi:hypothetical protein